jgi:hypothetical protein
MPNSIFYTALDEMLSYVEIVFKHALLPIEMDRRLGLFI